MSATPFRPRSVSELVDAAFQLLRRDHLQYALATALVYVPFTLAAIAFGVRYAGTLSPMDANGNLETGMMFAGLGIALGFVVVLTLVDAVVIVASSDAYRGAGVDVASAYRRAAPRLPAVLGAVLVKLIAIFGRFFLAIIAAGIIAGLITAVAPSPILGGVVVTLAMAGAVALACHAAATLFAVPAATILDPAGPWRTIGRSRELSAGLRWHIFKAIALVWVIYLLLATGITIGSAVGTAASGGNRLVTIVLQLIGVAFTIFVYPIIGIVRTLLYYDARIRKEGYDLELLAHELGALPDGAPGAMPGAMPGSAAGAPPNVVPPARATP